MTPEEFYDRRKKRKIKKTGAKKTPLSLEVKKVITYLIITLTSLILILSITFLYLTSNTAQKGYQLKQTQIKNDQLRAEREDLHLKIVEATSYQKIQDNEKIDDMEKSTDKKFVEN